MPKTTTLVAVLCAAVLAACAATTDATAADEKSFNAAYEAADAARKQAASLGFEWRDTKKMLDEAKKAADKGDYETAEKLAMKAKREGEMGVAQAKEQEQAWRSAVLK